MIEMLAQGSRSAGEIAARFRISAPAVSQHLKALRETRLVRVEARGQQRIYTLAPDGFRPIDDWLARHIRFWSGRLDRLEAAVAQASSAATLNVADSRKSPPVPLRPKSGRHSRPRVASPAPAQTRKRTKS
jgi:DNA-binding transcriptional ArsR family regulator